MPTCIQLLDLTPDLFDQAERAIRVLAYLKWEAAGRPPGDGIDFWLLAEQDWIANCYVPSRKYEATESNPAVLTPSELRPLVSSRQSDPIASTKERAKATPGAKKKGS